ncbi:MAG: hypothetical protein OEY20_08700 [Gemmatimonadota bacterium]|nr:hypothetical protein [Gemmatimonadota bacterium]MDH5197317.1 hypothetical protein [Gemmatimonadota bacterium]
MRALGQTVAILGFAVASVVQPAASQSSPRQLQPHSLHRSKSLRFPTAEGSGGSSLVAELSLAAGGAILGAYVGTRFDNSGALSLVTTGVGAVGGVTVGAYASHRKPRIVGMIAGAAAAVLVGFAAGGAGAEDRSDQATAWLVFAHVLTVPAAAIGSHISF